MSLKNLLGISLDAVPPDRERLAKLLAGAERNLIDYSGDLVTEAEVTACLDSAARLRDHLVTWLQANRPELM